MEISYAISWYTQQMRYMGIDYGSKRIGIALSDENGAMAFPEAVVANNSKALGTIITLMDQKKVEVVVIGDSKNFKGEDNMIMSEVRNFVEKLKKQRNISIVFEPEFLTSAEAERLQGANEHIDASAAALILKSYLEKQTNAINWTIQTYRNKEEHLNHELFVVLIDTDQLSKFDIIKNKYQNIKNILITNHFDFQNYIINNFQLIK